MGMAASQARLLSITSRMADNELRSQIINNSKMRLATESSKVSEDYINALNSATMMMSNYDTAGESQYQKLTFNSLTSYSSYNNQYGLVNANGNIMVSEHDAAIYRDVIRTGGGLDEYLAAYGLEYTSTYFTKDTFDSDPVEITFEDYEGETQTLGSFTVEDLEAMYYGDDKNIGYNEALQSPEYVNFADYYEELVLADDNYYFATKEAVEKDIFETNWSDTSPKGWQEAYDKYVAGGVLGSVNDYEAAKDFLTNFLNHLAAEGKISNDNQWVKDMRAMINSLTFSNGEVHIESDIELEDSGNGEYQIGDLLTITNLGEDENGNIKYHIEHIQDKDTGTTFEYSYFGINVDEDGNFTLPKDQAAVQFEVTTKETSEDDGETSEYTYCVHWLNDQSKMDTVRVINYYDTPDPVKSMITKLYDEFQSGITSAINRDEYADYNDATKAAKERFDEAIEKYATLIFGNNLSQDVYDLIKNNLVRLSNPGDIMDFAQEKGLNLTEEFDVIKQIFILDQLFNVYGEPSAGWIDTNNPDENADAKVQWYTNLYNRMEKGYVVLEDGLASSNEWIEFAFESGLVTMEQVDSNNNWVSTIYTNCSDITEVTDDAAVARAEAEYNKAMNNIENKDKRFDMELKNIDTEHNSLQTEYDSVKSVIDKNIERSFKIYS